MGDQLASRGLTGDELGFSGRPDFSGLIDVSEWQDRESGMTAGGTEGPAVPSQGARSSTALASSLSYSRATISWVRQVAGPSSPDLLVHRAIDWG